MQAVEATQVDDTPNSMLGGIMITAGTGVGAGMFSLPVISAGMGFGWSIAAMLLSWFVMYQISLMILEVNLNFRQGDSFDTMVKDTLGKPWSVFNGFLLAFLLYILDYAYISGGGSIVNQTLQSTLGFAPPQMLSGLIFSLVLSFIVWFSTKAVDRVLTILIFAMVITFLMAVTNLTLAADIGKLFAVSTQTDSIPAFYYLFAALPFYLTSFGFHCTVPSMVKYYGKKPQLIARSMLIGSALCFVIYLLWLISVMGNLAQSAFLPIIEQGGNIGVLVSAVNNVANSSGLNDILNSFANMAIVSSFLGCSLALFDFIADKFHFADDGMGRFKTALIAFVPPTFGGVMFPHGFIAAIGFAGLVAAISALIIPPLMVKKSRQIFGQSEYQHSGGIKLVYFTIAMGVLYCACHILSMLGVLPVFGGSIH